MGNEETMTLAAYKAIETADIVIGAERLLLSDAVRGKNTHKEIISEKITDFILNHDEFENIAAVMSGDTGFYSGASKLRKLLKDKDGYRGRGNTRNIFCNVFSEQNKHSMAGCKHEQRPWKRVHLYCRGKEK